MFKSSSLSNYAPLQNPTFTGKVTLPDGSTITKSTSTYATKASPTFTGTVTFPDASTITDYLKSATATSTYAPKASPTFTGTVTANGGVTTAGLSNTGNFTLCTSLTTPTAGQLGYIITGTISVPTITSGIGFNLCNFAVGVGVWKIVSQFYFYVTGTAGTAYTAQSSITSGGSRSGTIDSTNLISYYNVIPNISTGQNTLIFNTTTSKSVWLNAAVTFTGTLTVVSGSCFFTAVRIA